MKKELIDYSLLIDEAMHSIVKKCLKIFAKHHAEQINHFFISFLTDYPGVVLSDKLKRRYPDEMTIVLQYHFEDLQIFDDKFSVILSFDSVKEKIEIPFKAMTAFADPSMKFGLQFKHAGIDDISLDDYDSELSIYDGDINIINPAETKKTSKSNNSDKADRNNVISLDQFRNKK